MVIHPVSIQKPIFSNTYSPTITIYFGIHLYQVDREPFKWLFYSVKRIFLTFFGGEIKPQKWSWMLAKVFQFKESPTILSLTSISTCVVLI